MVSKIKKNIIFQKLLESSLFIFGFITIFKRQNNSPYINYIRNRWYYVKWECAFCGPWKHYLDDFPGARIVIDKTETDGIDPLAIALLDRFLLSKSQPIKRDNSERSIPLISDWQSFVPILSLQEQWTKEFSLTEVDDGFVKKTGECL